MKSRRAKIGWGGLLPNQGHEVVSRRIRNEYTAPQAVGWLMEMGVTRFRGAGRGIGGRRLGTVLDRKTRRTAGDRLGWATGSARRSDLLGDRQR